MAPPPQAAPPAVKQGVTAAAILAAKQNMDSQRQNVRLKEIYKSKYFLFFSRINQNEHPPNEFKSPIHSKQSCREELEMKQIAESLFYPQKSKVRSESDHPIG